jgi:predicted choloylglycine hydrolase
LARRDRLVVDVVELKGSRFQIGLEQGRRLTSTKMADGNGFNRPRRRDFPYHRAANLLEKFSSHLFNELKGLAKGLDRPLEEVLASYSGYDVLFPEMGCTAFANEAYYVRNYDFSPELYDARLVWTRPKNKEGYASVGFSQHLVGRLDGMNEKGLVIGLHFVNDRHRQEGFLATTIVRMLLDQCATTEEAVAFIAQVPHGYCYNYSMLDANGNRAVVEASLEQQVIQRSAPLRCTNHFEAEELKRKNRTNIQGSVARKQYLQSLSEESLDPLALFQRFNNEASPLFFHRYSEYFGTLHTVVYSPKDLTVIIGVGQNSTPRIFSFKEWLRGALSLPKTIAGTISFEDSV